MTRAFHFLAIFSLAIGLVGCRTFHVQTDWDPTISFEDHQRYLWVEPPEVEGANPFADNTLLRKRVRFAIETELVERGFRSVETRESAEFLVTYSVILEQRINVDNYSSVGFGFHHRFGGHGQFHTGGNLRAFEESTLIIDLLDPNSDDLVWRGWGTGIIRTRDRKRGGDRLEAGVREILKFFPPRKT